MGGAWRSILLPMYASEILIVPLSFFVTCHIPKLSYWTRNLAIDIVVPNLSQVGMSLPSLS